MYDWLARVEREKRSLGLFAREHPVRQAATDLLHFRFAGTSIGFDTVILGFILLSSITMGFESCDLDLESTFAHILYWVDAGVTGALDAMPPTERCGYLSRNHATSMPP